MTNLTWVEWLFLVPITLGTLWALIFVYPAAYRASMANIREAGRAVYEVREAQALLEQERERALRAMHHLMVWSACQGCYLLPFDEGAYA
jgi:hypothetical protein